MGVSRTPRLRSSELEQSSLHQRTIGRHEFRNEDDAVLQHSCDDRYTESCNMVRGRPRAGETRSPATDAGVGRARSACIDVQVLADTD